MQEHKWDLSLLSPGERSALRKNAGVMMNMASAKAIEAFYRALTKAANSFTASIWFAALCMQCLWREEDHPVARPFQEMLGDIYQDKNSSESSKIRCTSFLDITWGEDGFLLGKINNLVRKMRTNDPGVIPNFEELAEDLAHWNSADRYIQKKWLRAICINTKKNEEEEEKSVD